MLILIEQKDENRYIFALPWSFEPSIESISILESITCKRVANQNGKKKCEKMNEMRLFAEETIES